MSKEFNGLTHDEVEKSKALNGDNRLIIKEGESFFEKLINNLKEPFMKILIFSLIITCILTMCGQGSWSDIIGISIAIVLSSVIGTWSEFSNEKGFQKLQEDASKINVKVYRNNKICEISIDDIVSGDYVILQSGDKIPADGFIIDGTIKVDNSSLNGESEEIKKSAIEESKYKFQKVDFTDDNNVYRGSVVCSGEAVMKVTFVGMKSQYGKLIDAMDVEERLSPLQLKLKGLADFISKVFGYIGSTVIFLAFVGERLVHTYQSTGTIMPDMLTFTNTLIQGVMLAVTILVMAVPEGLPMMISMVLAQNMKKMLKDNILVRKMIGIETAGSLNILFSDKTGTITKGQLEVIEFTNGNLNSFKEVSTIPEHLRKVVSDAIANNTGAMISENGEVLGGNATDKAVLKFLKNDMQNYEQIEIDTFSSDKKYSATTVVKDKEEITYFKGAPEKLLNKCNFYIDENGIKKEFSNFKNVNGKIDELAQKSIRVICLAQSNEKLTRGQLPKELTFIGILAIRDDVRPEAVQAIEEVTNAGIQVVMITGDRKETAIAIAKDAGLLVTNKDIILTSDELNEMNDDEVKNIIPNLKVLARALPTDKSRLVKLAQELDLVVGMTGDGVNDSPALKQADVGFAMGTGTEVAKEAGDIIILDDNFKSISKTILYGRAIYNNIRKFIQFQLTINVSAVAISAISPFIGIEFPLSVTQILWVNLIMDTLGALAFGGEPALSKYMKEKPKKRTESILSKNMKSSIIFNGSLLTIMGIALLKLPILKNQFRNSDGDIIILTAFFTFFVLGSVCNGFNTRTNNCNLFENIKENPMFLKVMSIITIIQIIMTFIGGDILRCSPLNLREWILVTILSIIIIPLDIVRKMTFKE